MSMPAFHWALRSAQGLRSVHAMAKMPRACHYHLNRIGHNPSRTILQQQLRHTSQLSTGQIHDLLKQHLSAQFRPEELGTAPMASSKPGFEWDGQGEGDDDEGEDMDMNLLDVWDEEELPKNLTNELSPFPVSRPDFSTGHFYVHMLQMKRVAKATKSGRNQKFSALVVAGNGHGTGGFGQGKAQTPQEAAAKAAMDTMKNIIHIDRFDSRTLFHKVEGRYRAAIVQMGPRGAGRGIMCNETIGYILEVFGITDVWAKCHGSRNRTNMVRAVFDGFTKQETPESVAARTGMRVLDFSEYPVGRNFDFARRIPGHVAKDGIHGTGKVK